MTSTPDMALCSRDSARAWARLAHASPNVSAARRSTSTRIVDLGRKRVGSWPTLEARISVDFHSFWLIFGRAIISRGELKAWMLSSWESLLELREVVQGRREAEVVA